MTLTVQPFDHQQESINMLSCVPYGADFSEPGTGKTLVQIALIDLINNGARALVLAPKSILHAAWENDFRKFAPHITTQVIRTSHRKKDLETSAQVLITNLDAVRWLVNLPASYWRGFDRIIVDESSAFKNPQAKRTKALLKFVDHFERRYILSGTPNPNSVTELWSQYALLDGGHRLGSSFYSFRNSATNSVQVGPNAHARKYTDKEGIAATVAGMVGDITIRHELDQCTDIPPQQEIVYPYRPPPKLLNRFNDLKREMILYFKDNAVSAANAAVLLNKLMQVASGAVYDDFGSYELLDDTRTELVTDLIEQRKHSVCFFYWQHQKEQLHLALKKRGISTMIIDGKTSADNRHRAVQLFQAGMVRCILAHPATAAHGLTLTRGTASIFAGPTFNLEWFLQGKRRIRRTGQNQKTQNIMVIAEGTCDPMIHARLTGKSTAQELLLEALSI